MSGRNDPGTRELARVFAVMLRPSRPHLVLGIWRWRWEIWICAGTASVLFVLVRLAEPAGAAWTVAVCGSAVALWPAGREAVTRRFWCIVTPHRIRVACLESMIYTTGGKAPVVLMTLSRPYGERVYLWCRGATHPGDLVAISDRIAASCWAPAVKVTPWPRRANVAVVHVLRRPLPGPPPD